MSNSIEKIAFHTLGCKLNFSESSTISRDFKSQGFSIVKDFENADIHVINTCSVTEKADKKAKRIIKKIMQTSNNPYIAVMGCYAQLQPNQISEIDGVNLVIGDKEKLNAANHIIKNFHSAKTKIIHSSIENSFDFKSSFSMNDRVRSYLKIQDGCNYPCTYCTIPMARGESRSDNIENIINNIKILEKNKVSEVILTGVNIGDYYNHNHKFIDIIKNLEAYSSISRIRISSIEPNLLTRDIIKLIKNSGSFLPHFHIPLQSGSDKVLALMKRKYNTKIYQNKIEMIRKEIPNACIGADVIVGFPGETHEDFLITLNFIKNLNIDYLHVFSYSDRANTEASAFKVKISNSEKIDRSRILQSISNKKRLKFYNSNLSMVRKVLFENITENKYVTGFSDNYIRIFVDGDNSMINKIFNVELLEIDNDRVFGKII